MFLHKTELISELQYEVKGNQGRLSPKTFTVGITPIYFPVVQRET
jgi:hypothetical protein